MRLAAVYFNGTSTNLTLRGPKAYKSCSGFVARRKGGGMGFLKGLLLTVVTIGSFACGRDSPENVGLHYDNQGTVSAPVNLTPGVVTPAHVGRGTSYYSATASPGTTYTVTVIMQTFDRVVLRVHKGDFSSPVACTSDTGGSKEECSVTMTALETALSIEVTNNNTVFGTPFTITVH